MLNDVSLYSLQVWSVKLQLSVLNCNYEEVWGYYHLLVLKLKALELTIVPGFTVF